MNIKLPKLQKVTLESGTRFYVTPTGFNYPSVTTVLSEKKKEQLRKWREEVGEEEADRIKNAACKRGTALHTLCEKYLRRKRKYKDVAGGLYNQIVPYLDKISNIFCLEQHLYSDELRVAGQVDCIGMYEGRASVIDFKTSSKEKKIEYIWDYFMQASAYSYMFEEHTGIAISDITIIISCEGGKVQVFQDKREKWIKGFMRLRNDYYNTVELKDPGVDNKPMSGRITVKWTKTVKEAFGDNKFTQKGLTAEELVHNYLKRVYEKVVWHQEDRSKQVSGKDFEFKKSSWRNTYSADVKGNLSNGKFFVYIDEIKHKSNDRMIHVDTESGWAVEYSRGSMVNFLYENDHLLKIDKNNKRYALLDRSDPTLKNKVQYFRPFRVA